MRKRACLAGAALVLAPAISALGLPTAAHAQQSGESRCGADGYVERYSEVLHSWSSSSTRCAGGGSSGYATDQRRRGETEEGDTKCGADGKVYTYIGHSWVGGIANCH